MDACTSSRRRSGRPASSAGASGTRSIDDEQLPLLYRRATVLVLPTVETTCFGVTVAVTELLGLCLLEAMAGGTPVVASRTGGVPEVVCDGETGFLVRPGDVTELHDRIDLLLRNPRLARRIGCAARGVVLDRFTWQATAQRCLAAYERFSPARTGV